MEMSQGVRLQLEADRVPVLPGAREAYDAGIRTSANRPNRENCGSRVSFDVGISELEQELYFDPQTSGGLLVAIPSEQVDDVLAAIQGGGDTIASQIGRVVDGDGVHVV